jgi:hypothetical protein
MPTVLTWTYVGKHATVIAGDVQRIKAGGIGEVAAGFLAAVVAIL